MKRNLCSMYVGMFSARVLTLVGTLLGGCSGSGNTATMIEVDAAMPPSFDMGMIASFHLIPDTGQTTSYTNTPGEDSDYLINPQQFVDKGDGTVSESVTGLLWQKVDGGEMTFESAQAYVKSLSLGGKTGWRLPTPQEAIQLLNHDANNPALDTKFFPASAAEYYWTSDTQVGDATRVWVTNVGGGLGPHPKTETISAGGTHRFHVRAVYGSITPGHSFVDGGNGTITDVTSGLVWQQADSGVLTWDAGLRYAEGLSLAGFDDWRMPNVKELQSLSELGQTTTPQISKTFFPAAKAMAYWSSTTLKQGGSTTSAWVVEFGVNTTSNPPRGQPGIVSYDLKTLQYPVRCVRGPVQ